MGKDPVEFLGFANDMVNCLTIMGYRTLLAILPTLFGITCHDEWNIG